MEDALPLGRTVPAEPAETGRRRTGQVVGVGGIGSYQDQEDCGLQDGANSSLLPHDGSSAIGAFAALAALAAGCSPLPRASHELQLRLAEGHKPLEAVRVAGHIGSLHAFD